MKRQAQPMLSEDGKLALDLYGQVLQQFEDISPVTIRNYLSDLRQFRVWFASLWPLHSTSLHRRILRLDLRAVNSFYEFFRDRLLLLVIRP